MLTLSPMERILYMQFDLGPVMRRGAVIHWSCADSLLERRSLLLLGASHAHTQSTAHTAHLPSVHC